MNESSAAVCWNCALYILAFHADQLSVFASINTARQTTKNTCEVKQAAAPSNCHATYFSTNNMGGVCSTKLAGSAIVVIIRDVDDSGALRCPIARSAISRLSVGGCAVTGCPISRWRGSSIARLLSVHSSFLENNIET